MWLLIVVLVLARVVMWVRPLEVLAARRLAKHLRADEQGITVGASDVIAWSEIQEVRVETTADGPLSEDYFLALVVDGRRPVRIAEPLVLRVLEHIQRLPNFDNETLMGAMACIERAAFTCWKRGVPP